MPEINTIQQGMPQGIPQGIPQDIPQDMPQVIPSQDPKELRSILDSQFEGVKKKEKDLDAKKALNKNVLDEKRNDLMRSLFEMMEEAGVDLNDLESISKFVAGLEQRNPDLAEMFDNAFSGLTGEKEKPEDQGAGMMGQFNNLQQGIMRQ